MSFYYHRRFFRITPIPSTDGKQSIPLLTRDNTNENGQNIDPFYFVNKIIQQRSAKSTVKPAFPPCFSPAFPANSQHHRNPQKPHSDLDLAIPEVPLHLALHCLFLEVVSLVVELLASRKTDLHLDASVLEVDLKRHQGVALGLHLSGKFHDLALVKQELSLSEGLAVENIAFLVGTDIHTLHKGFAVINGDIGLLDAALALPDRFHLCSEQFDPCLVFLFYEIVVVGLLVVASILPVRSRNSFFLPLFLPFSLSGSDSFLPSPRFEKCL